jgi:hypothetical protein
LLSGMVIKVAFSLIYNVTKGKMVHSAKNVTEEDHARRR